MRPTVPFLLCALALFLAVPLLATGAEPTIGATPDLETTLGIGRATIEVNGRPAAFVQRPGYTVRRSVLYTRAGSRVGRSYLICFWVSRYEQGCTGTFSFPKGIVTVAGPVQDNGYVLAVTGGTGFYDNARGAVRVQPSGPQVGNRVFFQLVG